MLFHVFNKKYELIASQSHMLSSEIRHCILSQDEKREGLYKWFYESGTLQLTQHDKMTKLMI